MCWPKTAILTLAWINLPRLVNEKSNGTIQIEVHTDGTLGQEREMMESLQLGNLDLALVSTAPISNFYPKMSVLDMPYLFDSKSMRMPFWMVKSERSCLRS